LPFGPERNVGYAVQWFGLAVALLIIYLVVNTRKAR
jgi:surfeit locus 1 family protein